MKFCVVLFLSLWTPVLEAADRVAVLIGNGGYKLPAVLSDTVCLEPLPNPAQDLRLMENLLRAAGFECTVLPDRTTAQMRSDVKNFAAVHKGAPDVLFYYSGHGLQQDGVNYLAGIDARIDVADKLPPLENAVKAGAMSPKEFEEQLTNLKRRNAQEQLLPLDEVLQTLNEISTVRGHRKIVLLDACRNPFVKSDRERSVFATKSAGVIGKGAGGLAKPAERPGMFIGFSAAAGEVSLGLPNEASLFTRVFCQEAAKPDVTLRDVFDNTAQKVFDESTRLFNVERARAARDGQSIGGFLQQEAQTPAAYNILFPPGFAFISRKDKVSIPAKVSVGEPGTPPGVAAPKLDVKTGMPNSGFIRQHQEFVAIARSGEAQLVFLGDSVTAGWAGSGREIWEKSFARWKCANFGIGGDQTQHVLWRLENGELENFKPKVIVLLIGTNNTGLDSSEAIAWGISRIVETIRGKAPATKILLLGILPRGEKPSRKDEPNPGRDKITVVNALIARLADEQGVHFLDMGDRFLKRDGTIPKEVMPDFLHLSPAGYQIWADAITPKLTELMK